ncbi:MAG TPA: SAM-dependent methyltransferase [Candidatus Limnocylindria bacterium]|nr:SAM-dependent methyltransferase [Candidatus Limnocylindria bacterium]
MISGARHEFQSRLQEAVTDGSFVRLTLAGPLGDDPTLRQLLVRPVQLRAGPRLAFLWRHATRDVTKNHPAAEALARLAELIGAQFTTAHLFTTRATIHLELRPGRPPQLHAGPPTATTGTPPGGNDRDKSRPVPAPTGWLHTLGVTTAEGKVRAGMEAKFRQINRFVELLTPLLAEASLPAEGPLGLVDMGCGKGYLTFAARECLGRFTTQPVQVRGVEARPELVALSNRAAREAGLDGLEFVAGNITDAPLAHTHILVALHACDTATDDALARGVAAGASLLLVAPCCHKEVRPRLTPPPAFAEALRHGIFRERQAEFLTDALRAALLEWAGYRTHVMEFISPEHTGKNLLITAVKRQHPSDREAAARSVRDLAGLYGLRRQALADRLGFDLTAAGTP